MITKHIFFNIIFNKKTLQPISISLISDSNKCLYFEFNDFIKPIENEIYNNLDFKNYQTLIQENKEKISGKDCLINISLIINKWLEQFDNIVFIGDSLNYKTFNINSVFDCCNLIDISDLFIKNGLKLNYSRVKLSDSDTTRNFYHSFYDCEVLKSCYTKLIKGKKSENLIKKQNNRT
jgi:hypothetical protein